MRCALSLAIRGWCNYYCYAVAKRTFCALDDHVWRITYRWAKRRHPNKTRHWVVNRYFGVDRGTGGSFVTAGSSFRATTKPGYPAS